MAYKNKLILLMSIIAALGVVYALTFILDAERLGGRSSSMSWLAPSAKDGITRISVKTGEYSFDIVKSDSWSIDSNGKSYPAKTARVTDLLDSLSSRSVYSVRSSSSSVHERLGLTEALASRVTLYGGDPRSPVLDLLIGYEDPTGREVFMRRANQSEVRSGEYKIASYFSSSVQSWYNLRLIPENESNRLDSDIVQRLAVYPEPDVEPIVFTRWNNRWVFSGMEINDPDYDKVESYIRSILYADGDDFIDFIAPNDPVFEYSRIVMDFADGTRRTIRISESDEDGRCLAAVDARYVYSISGWAVERLFREGSWFARQ